MEFDKRPQKREFKRCLCEHGGHKHDVEMLGIFNGFRTGGRSMIGKCTKCMCNRLHVKETLTLNEYFSKYGNT